MFIRLSPSNYRVGENRDHEGGEGGDGFRCSATAVLQLKAGHGVQGVGRQPC